MESITDFEITTFVLAGGKSTRMGSDKAFLELGGRTLLARTLDLAASIDSPVMIVGERIKFARFGPVVEDIYHAHGPLGGIQAGLDSPQRPMRMIDILHNRAEPSEFYPLTHNHYR